MFVKITLVKNRVTWEVTLIWDRNKQKRRDDFEKGVDVFIDSDSKESSGKEIL